MGEEGLADRGTKDSKRLAVKSCRDCEGGRNSQYHRRVHWMWEVREVTESGTRAE